MSDSSTDIGSDSHATIRVQICYAKPNTILLEEVVLPSTTTLEQAIHASTILAQAPEIDLTVCKVGIYGKLKPLNTLLRDQDRIEIYRPLLADPMEARRRRVIKKAR